MQSYAIANKPAVYAFMRIFENPSLDSTESLLKVQTFFI